MNFIKKLSKKTKIIKIFILVFAITSILPQQAYCSTKKSSNEIKTITISAVGDCTLGKNYTMKYENSWNNKFDTEGSEYFLKNLSTVFKQDDITIANLEGVLSSKTKRQETIFNEKLNKTVRKKYSHLGKPEYIQALTNSGIDIVSFANNHNIDYGLKGFKDTIKSCKKHDLPVAYYDNIVKYKTNGLTVGIASIDSTYCSNTTAKKYLKKAIRILHKDCDLIIICAHWGKNYQTYPNKDQQELGHMSIDLGADLVLGHHPHIIQGVERYKGRYIFYSLGNFTYGGRAIPKDIDTLFIQKKFTFINGKLRIDDNVQIFPCWMSSQREINDFCPILKEGAIGQAIIEKVNSRSKPFLVKFNQCGIPILSPENNTDLDTIITSTEEKTERIPQIIKKLLNI